MSTAITVEKTCACCALQPFLYLTTRACVRACVCVCVCVCVCETKPEVFHLTDTLIDSSSHQCQCPVNLHVFSL